MALRQRKTGSDGEEKESLLEGSGDRSGSPSRDRDELPEAFGQVILSIQNYLSLIGPYARYVWRQPLIVPHYLQVSLFMCACMNTYILTFKRMVKMT